GVQAALSIIVEGSPVAVEKAKTLGVMDEVVEGDLRAAALAYAGRLASESRPPRPTRDLAVPPVPANVFDDFDRAISKKQRGFLAPFHAIKAVRAATELPFDAGMQLERDLFVELMASPQSRAQRHVFFAEREVAKIP